MDFQTLFKPPTKFIIINKCKVVILRTIQLYTRTKEHSWSRWEAAKIGIMYLHSQEETACKPIMVIKETTQKTNSRYSRLTTLLTATGVPAYLKTKNNFTIILILVNTHARNTSGETGPTMYCTVSHSCETTSKGRTICSTATGDAMGMNLQLNQYSWNISETITQNRSCTSAWLKWHSADCLREKEIEKYMHPRGNPKHNFNKRNYSNSQP